MPSAQATLSFDILVVDDEPPISELLTRIAQHEFPQAKIIPTHSIQQTLEYLQTRLDHPPQLILLDIDLRYAQDGLSLLP
ncbi:response regulator [Spirosoma gilvum]